MSGRERAVAWIEEHGVHEAPVFLPDEMPDDVLRTLVWPIIEALTRRYAPAVVERDSAVRLYLGKTDPGPEVRIRQTGGTRWRAEIAPGVVVRVERGEVGNSQIVKVGEAEIPVDPPEPVILGGPLRPPDADPLAAESHSTPSDDLKYGSS